jgi:ribosomal protein S6--L-glutamate ligase
MGVIGAAVDRDRPRIALIMKRYPPSQVGPVMPAVCRSLRDRGNRVDIVHPEERLTGLDGLRVDRDLYVLKSKTELARSLAGALDALGAAILNPFSVAMQCRDKAVATKILQEAGVPTPETFVAAHPADLGPALREGTLVVKPHRGSGGRGVRVVRTEDDLASLAPSNGVIFAQRYHRPQGPDHKIYRIGDQVFGVERVWPPRTYEEKLGRAFVPSPEEREIALRCGEAFGIDLYGIDIVISDGRPYVVDISSFPGFKGIPGAAGRIAQHIHAAALRAAGEEKGS